MIRLVRVELTRFRSRRAVLAIAVVGVVLAGVFAVKTGYDSRPFSAEETATARAQADMADAERQSDLAECQKSPRLFLGPDGTAQECADVLLPKTSDFLTRSPLRLRVVMQNNGLDVALLLLVLLVLGGATFAGSDFASGSIRGQVLVEPRRSRVWGAKAIAVGLGSLAIALVAMAVFWVPLWFLSVERDLPVASGSMVVWHVVRTLVLAAVAPVFAYALTVLFRHTVATIGILFGLSLAAEVLLGPLPIQGTGRLSPSNNVFAWLLGHTRYFDPSLSCGAADCGSRTLSMWPAGLLMAVVVVVVLGLSWQMFRRRDLP